MLKESYPVKAQPKPESGLYKMENNTISTTEEEARQRLDAILSDRLLWFNPYRVADRALLECADRGRWSLFPALTQMLVLHFKEIRDIPAQRGFPAYKGLFFSIGDLGEETHVSVSSLVCPMTHIVTRRPVWVLVNDRNLVRSNINRIEGRSLFVSHAITCCRESGEKRPAYRMYRLCGNEARCAAIVRRSMCAAKLTMLNEVLSYPAHPDYLGRSCRSFDYAGPIRKVMADISRFPDVSPPTTHIIV